MYIHARFRFEDLNVHVNALYTFTGLPLPVVAISVGIRHEEYGTEN